MAIMEYFKMKGLYPIDIKKEERDAYVERFFTINKHEFQMFERVPTR